MIECAAAPGGEPGMRGIPGDERKNPSYLLSKEETRGEQYLKPPRRYGMYVRGAFFSRGVARERIRIVRTWKTGNSPFVMRDAKKTTATESDI